jgi:nicotinamidase-related amidase
MPPAGKLQRAQTQLLIIDIQERLAPAVLNHEALILKVDRLTRLAKLLDIPITVSEQYPKGLGATVSPLRETVGNASVFLDKMHFSCMAEDRISGRLAELRGHGRGQILLTGMEAHVCVAQTALDLAAAGYSTFIAADAVSSRTRDSRDLALERMRGAGCIIIDTEMAMFEWTERAGTPEFKAMQALIKEGMGSGTGAATPSAAGAG